MIRNRPAETSGGVGAIATAIALAVGADAATVGVVGIVAGSLPALVTYLHEHGGIRGVWRSLLNGSGRGDA